MNESFVEVSRSGHELDCRALRREMKRTGITLSVLESLESRVEAMIVATKAGRALVADRYFEDHLPASLQVATAFRDDTRQHKKNELFPEEHHNVVVLKIKSPVKKVIKSFKCIDGRWQILFKNGRRYRTEKSAGATWKALIALATSPKMDKSGFVPLPQKIGALAKGYVEASSLIDVESPRSFLQAKGEKNLYRFVLPADTVVHS